MKAQILKISGHKNEKDFYKEFPTEEAFMAKHGAAFKKAQYGKTFFGGNPSDVDYGDLTYSKQGDTDFMNQGMNAVGDTPGSTTASKLGGGSDNTGAYVQAAVDTGVGIAEGARSAKSERKLVKQLQGQAAASDVVLKSFFSKDVDAPNQLATLAKRRREALMPVVTGNQLFPNYGTGTNILAKSGAKIKKGEYGANNYLNSPQFQKNAPSWVSAAQSAEAISSNLGEGPDAGNRTGGAIGAGIGTVVGTYFGGPLGGAVLGAVGKWAGGAIGGAMDTNDEKIKDATKRIKNNASIISGMQTVRGSYSAYAKNGGTHKVGDVTALSGGELEPISYNPYSDGTGITSMVKGQTHEESNGRHTGVLLSYDKAENGSMSPDVEAENNEPITEIGDSAVVFGDQVINDITVGGDPMFKGLYGKTFKKAMAGVAEQNAKLSKDKDKLTKDMALYNPTNQLDKLEGNTLFINNKALNMKYAMNDVIMRKAAAHQEIINQEAERLGINSGDFSRGKITPIDNVSTAQGGKTTKRKQIEPITLESKPVVQGPKQEIVAPLPWLSKPPVNSDADDKTFGVTPYQKWGVESILSQALPFFRRQPGEELAGDQILPEMSALASNKEEPVDARFYRPQLRTPYDISFQDQLNENQADFNQLIKASGNNPQALAALASQKYGANAKVLAEQFRANQAQKDQVYSGNLATLNDAQQRNLQIMDQQYVRQAQAKSATKAVRQQALTSIAGKVAQNRLENRTLQTYANMFPDYSFDKNYRIQKTGAPIDWQIDQGIYNKKGDVTEVPVYDEQGDITSYKSITAKAKNGSITKAFREL